MKTVRLTEAQFTRQVIQFAQLHGWRVAHFRAAMTAQGWRTPCQGNAQGFPDLVLVHARRGQVVFAELKVGKGKPTAEQEAWLDDLHDAGEVVRVWYPENWGEIEALLSGGR